LNAIFAFTYKATEEHKEIVEKCLSILEKEYKLLDIPSHRVEDHLKGNMMAISFGKLAEMQVQSCIADRKLIGVKHEKLPHPKQLVKIAENKDTREVTLNTLTKLKEELALEIYQPEVKKYEEGDLPDLEHRQLLLLQKLVEESSKGYCIQTTKNGKLIAIGATPQSGKAADIQMSFQELFLLRLAMDILGVTEVDIVTAPTGIPVLPDKKAT
jgi:hypothetical protein